MQLRHRHSWDLGSIRPIENAKLEDLGPQEGVDGYRDAVMMQVAGSANRIFRAWGALLSSIVVRAFCGCKTEKFNTARMLSAA